MVGRIFSPSFQTGPTRGCQHHPPHVPQPRPLGRLPPHHPNQSFPTARLTRTALLCSLLRSATSVGGCSADCSSPSSVFPICLPDYSPIFMDGEHSTQTVVLRGGLGFSFVLAGRHGSDEPRPSLNPSTSVAPEIRVPGRLGGQSGQSQDGGQVLLFFIFVSPVLLTPAFAFFALSMSNPQRHTAAHGRLMMVTR